MFFVNLVSVIISFKSMSRLLLFLLVNTSLVISTKSVSNIYDLSWDYVNGTVAWIGDQNFIYTKIVTQEQDGVWYSTNEFCTAEHSGTHLDAPYHFNKNGWTVGEIPLNRLIAKGALINLENVTNNSFLLVKHLEDFEREHGSFEQGTVLLVRFGWSKRWNTTNYFGDKNLNFPGISQEAAEWVADSNKFYGVGVDSPSVDSGLTSGNVVHQIFSKKQMFNLENVKLLEGNLPSTNFTLVIAPMKLKEGTGAPVRIFATF